MTTLTAEDVGCMKAGGGDANAAVSAPMVTFSRVGVTHSMRRLVAYFTRY